MKKLLFFLLLFLFVITLPITVVNAEEKQTLDIDSSVNAILDGIDDKTFEELNDTLNLLFNDDKSIKDRILLFITGGINLDVNSFFRYFTSGYSGIINSVVEIMCYVLFVGILCTVINKIIAKNNDNSEKNIIYLICYALVVMLSAQLVSKVFDSAILTIDKMNKTIELTFPTLITLSEFAGGFGSILFKPITGVLSVITSALSKSFFLPLLYSSAVCVIVGNLSNTVKLNSLKKSLLSLVKWSLGILTLSFTVFMTAQGMVNSQYNGMSFKVLKYATGSLIPIVGNFISGGMDVLLSSAVLVKNSFGLILVIYVFLTVGGAGISILITSFIIKFMISVCEPVIDAKFVEFSNGLSDVLSCLSAVIFVCGFAYVLVCFSVITSTALII